MNSSDELLRKLHEETPMLEAWGMYINNYVRTHLENISDDIYKILKIPLGVRIKQDDSFIAKAFFRGKKYTDPYNDITDKVGVRFVVLVVSHIYMVKSIIEKNSEWSVSKDKDYEKDVNERPDVFSYESVHYIIRPNKNIMYNGAVILKDTPCEVQIRTLEQHAYAEISHDYFYKGDKERDVSLKRNLARSMALNETTDILFEKVYRMVEVEKTKYKDFFNKLKSMISFQDYDEKVNIAIYDDLQDMINRYVTNLDEVKSAVSPYFEIINEQKYMYINKQPMVIILYYLAKKHSNELEDQWKFTRDFLEPIYTNLGISFDKYY